MHTRFTDSNMRTRGGWVKDIMGAISCLTYSAAYGIPLNKTYIDNWDTFTEYWTEIRYAIIAFMVWLCNNIHPSDAVFSLKHPSHNPNEVRWLIQIGEYNDIVQNIWMWLLFPVTTWGNEEAFITWGEYFYFVITASNGTHRDKTQPIPIYHKLTLATHTHTQMIKNNQGQISLYGWVKSQPIRQ